MKKAITKILSVALVVVMTLTAAPLSGFVGIELPKWLDFSIDASAATSSGICGNNLTWTFDNSTGTLIISGTGDMDNYGYNNYPWESYNNNIKKVVINDGATTIEDGAFEDCSNLTSVTIPDSIITIGNYAFNSCTNLTSMTIGDGVTTIGDNAFGYCSSLMEATIPDSVITIDDYAFYSCTNLTTVTIGDSVTTIGSRAFYWCSNLTNVTIGNSVTTIGDSAFYECYSLANATIPNSVKTIGNMAFYGCKSLTNLTLPNSVTAIGNNAFADCENLTNVTIPDSMQNIDSNAFARCSSLKTFRMPILENSNSLFSLEQRSASKITIANGEIVVDFADGDQTTIVEIGEDVTSFDCFASVMGICGLVEEIVLDSKNTELKLIDGVLYNSDITELCLYPTAFDKTVYEMPDTVVSEFASSNYISAMYSDVMLTIVGSFPFSVVNAVNLEKLTFGANYRHFITDDMVSNLLEVIDSCTTEAEKIESMFSLANEFSLLSLYSAYCSSNLKEFYVDDNNKYLTSKNGVLFFKYEDYNIAIRPIVSSVEKASFTNKDILGIYTLLFVELDELEITDDFIELFSNVIVKNSSYDESNYYEYLSYLLLPFISSRVGSYEIADSSKYFSTVDGVLFSKDGNALLAYPINSARTLYEIPSTVKFISPYAFSMFGEGRVIKNKDLTIHITESAVDAIKASGTLTAFMVPGTICFEDEKILTEITGMSIDEFNLLVAKQEAENSSNFAEIESTYDTSKNSTFIMNKMIEIYRFMYLNQNLAFAKICNSQHDVDRICSFGEWTTVTEATCTEDGLEKRECVTCGDEETRTVKALDHDFSTEWTIDVPASCKETGSKSHHCTRCNEKTDVTEIPMDEHSYAKVTTPPTCTEQGYTTYTCECGDTHTADIVSPSGHNYVIGVCTICADEIPSGVCGDNLVWMFDESTRTLTISGSGAMYDYDYGNSPWTNYMFIINEVVIEEGVTTIGDCAFYYCHNITSISIPNSVTSIGELAFYECSSIPNITIPDSVTSIGAEAFRACTSLISVAIPDSVTLIGYDAFCRCDILTSITVDSNNQYYSSDEYGVLFNKDKTILYRYPAGNQRINYIIPNSVTEISDFAFQYCKNLTDVTIPNSVITIGKAAFSLCYGFTNITIPDSITVINENVFLSCTGLKSVTIPNSVTTIGYEAFYGCTSLTDITIPDSVTTIDSYAFYKCTNLPSITIPDSVELINEYAFLYCTSLKSITVDSNNQYFSSDEHGILFNKDKTTLVLYPAGITNTSYTVPDGINKIGENAFYGCSNLISIIIPDSVSAIGTCAFRECTNLTNITLPHSVTAIRYFTFYECDSFSDIYYLGTEKQWNKISIDDFNEPFLNATIHFMGNEHTCSFDEWTTVTEATCTEDGLEKRVCVTCEDEETRTVKALDHDFSTEWTIDVPASCKETGSKSHHCTRCNEKTDVTEIPMGEHLLEHVTVSSTCTVAGVKYDFCMACQSMFNYTVLPMGEHVFGEWKTVIQVTCTEDGVEQRTCTGCEEFETKVVDAIGHSFSEWILIKAPTFTSTGKETRTCKNCPLAETREIAKLIAAEEFEDEETGISISVTDNSYAGDIEVDVTPIYDGESYQIINSEIGNFQASVFDITTTINGDKVQPSGTVLVKMPIPIGYNPNSIAVYYIPNDGSAPIKMNSYVEGNYIYFETDHFSDYAIIDTSKIVETPEYDYTFSIQQPSTTSIRYKDGIILHASVKGTVPDGAKVVWIANNNKFKTSEQDNGNALKIISNSNGYTTFTAKLIDADGNELASDTIEMRSKAGLFDIIGGFFRGLFGLTKTYDK